MNLPFYIVDVFAEEKYSGNQLAVFENAENLTEAQMLQIAREINFAESTFITKIDPLNNSAEIRIFMPDKEMQFAGHPIIGTSWVLMNKIFENHPKQIELTVPIGAILVEEKNNLVWLQAAQPSFFDIFPNEGFNEFSNLTIADFDVRFPIQEVSTGSAFVIIPLASKEILDSLKLEGEQMKKWLDANCKTNHQALYFFFLENEKLYSRMLYLQDGQIKEDAATGSASTCLQAYLLQYDQPKIEITNNQGANVGRPSKIEFNGFLSDTKFDIKIGGKTQFVAKGEWQL